MLEYQAMQHKCWLSTSLQIAAHQGVLLQHNATRHVACVFQGRRWGKLYGSCQPARLPPRWWLQILGGGYEPAGDSGQPYKTV